MIMHFLYRTLKFYQTEWLRNYRYHGGIKAFYKCLRGTMRLKGGDQRINSNKTIPELDIITFSVIPKLTALWAVFIEKAITTPSKRIIIGDCSGNFKPLQENSRLYFFPILNYPHGEKIDLFMQKVCQAEFVLVCDDDVFWLDETPLNWALEQLEADPLVAVVSFMPRSYASSVLVGRVEQPMGSYCLILRRETWLRENLSFKIVYPPETEKYDWFYDTADYANVELLRRNYKILIAPSNLHNDIVSFEGTSASSLKIQEDKGDISHVVAGPVRKEKAFCTVLLAQGLATIIKDYMPTEANPDLIPSDSLSKAKAVCEKLIPETQRNNIQTNVNKRLGLLQDRMSTLER